MSTKKISSTELLDRDRQLNYAIKNGWLVDRVWSEQVWEPSSAWWKRSRYVLWHFAWLVSPPATAPSIQFRIGPVAERE